MVVSARRSRPGAADACESLFKFAQRKSKRKKSAVACSREVDAHTARGDLDREHRARAALPLG